ncbi:MAG: DNA polymerase ligase N-terminal domain-containing protein, partial [Pseudomonadales bacterium]
MPSRSLRTYRDKRLADATPEPFGRLLTPATGKLFVVQQHKASHMHWDLRLEMDGVLKSWAIPKGPSASAADKRFAAEVEDHPLDYGGFEGRIPPGNYGAGEVIVWDRGTWKPLNDCREGLR